MLRPSALALCVLALPVSACAEDDLTPGDEGVPQNQFCRDVDSWDAARVALEVDVLEIVNQHRQSGADCGSEGSFGPASILSMQESLRCAARVHSRDMADRNYFDHTGLDGSSPWDRMAAAGYQFSNAGENIAAGSADAAGTMEQWMNSDGHCANIMNPDFTEIGVGYAPGGDYRHVWTQVFGRPPGG